jgi:two-component system, NarL family, sensor histidine kinase UhpB
MSGGETSGGARPDTVSLRLALISLIGLVLVASLAVGAIVAALNASRSVQTEMRSALAVGQQVIDTGIARLNTSANPRQDLEYLVNSFKGNRHLKVTLMGDGAAMAAPPVEQPPLGQVPNWFVYLLGVKPTKNYVRVSVGEQDYGMILIETDPHNEILESWDKFGDSVLILALFSGPTALLIYFFIGRALRPLGTLANALGRIGEGDYAIRVGARMPRELSRLRDAFNRMAAQLANMHAENRRLNEQLLTLQEEERNGIARDLHDEIGPFLFAINVDTDNIARHVEAGRFGVIKTHLQSIADAVGHMQRQVRSMLGQLRPIGLADFGLTDAIGNLLDFWRRRYPDIAFELDNGPETDSFGELLDPTIYRVVQECLSNAVRHGAPKSIAVSLRHETADGRDEAVVIVADDGHGIAETPKRGYGLLGMGERVRALGGTLDFENRPGEGLTVTARIPLAERDISSAPERIAS